MIRVAFAIENTGSRWIGGVNYFCNLFSSINALPNTKIELVVIAGKNADVSHFDGYVKIIRSSLMDNASYPRLIRKVLQKVFKRDILLYLLLRRHNVDFLSHSSYLWKNCSISTLPWIPDFQSFHLPKLFDSRRLNKLKETYNGYVLLSSYSAKKDLESFVNGSHVDSKVLQFASTLMSNIEWKDRDYISSHYQLDRPWFHLPNQFWAHKNHAVVLEALKLAKDNGNEILVVTTGNTQDHRNPDFIAKLKDKVRVYGLEKNFLMLGIIPYDDMFSIMRHAIAVINPSKFEGWSTTVEEARSLGKQMILSDIDVHKEQNPARCHFFGSDDAGVLLVSLIQLESEFNSNNEEVIFNDAMSILSERQNNFAKKYQEIVFETISMNSK